MQWHLSPLEEPTLNSLYHSSYDVDYQSDANRFRIPYYSIFKNELTKTFGALWGANEDLIRPFAYLKLDDAGNVIPESMGLAEPQRVDARGPRHRDVDGRGLLVVERADLEEEPREPHQLPMALVPN